MTSIANNIRKHTPILVALIEPLEQAGHLRNVFVSRLRPGAMIHPHRGWTSKFLRIHLGLLCDPSCQITVGDMTQTWQPGKLLAFKDGGPYMHSVCHKGNRDRIVISFDLRLSYVREFIPNITLENA
jgi:aspartyl/asparaginyl beta-hydroxylase (cupin superfamily)